MEMKVKDLTVEELKSLISEAIKESLEEISDVYGNIHAKNTKRLEKS